VETTVVNIIVLLLVLLLYLLSSDLLTCSFKYQAQVHCYH